MTAATVNEVCPDWFESEAQELAELHWGAMLTFARETAQLEREYQYWAILSRALEIQDNWRHNSWIGSVR